jgi:hypothetical protein
MGPALDPAQLVTRKAQRMTMGGQVGPEVANLRNSIRHSA